jgi:hypothetical protein
VSRQWHEVEITLPTGASVEIDVESEGHLRAHLECHRDAVTLAILEDALRAAVVDVQAQRAILAAEARS